MSRFRFESVTDGDLPTLREWLDRPHVAEWWDWKRPARLEDVRAEFSPSCRDPLVSHYIAWEGDRRIGFIQSYVVAGAGGGWWPDERDPGARGIDQFLADPADLGRGLGTAMISAFVRRLFDDPAVTKVQIDPDPANARAIRCYEKVGFDRVGSVETPDGPALLMVILRR